MRRHTHTDATDTQPLTRDAENTDLRSTRRQTNTDTAEYEPLAQEIDNEDRQPARQQQNTSPENDEMVSQNPTEKENPDIPNFGGKEAIVPDTFDKENDDMVVEIESRRGGKHTLRPNPTPNYTEEYRY